MAPILIAALLLKFILNLRFPASKQILLKVYKIPMVFVSCLFCKSKCIDRVHFQHKLEIFSASSCFSMSTLINEVMHDVYALPPTFRSERRKKRALFFSKVPRQFALRCLLRKNSHKQLLN